MKTEILDILEKNNLFTHEITRSFGIEGGQVLRWLIELANDGLVRRLQSGAWAMHDLERRRRRNGRDYAERQRIAKAGNVKRDTSPFPRPGYETPNVGLWG